MRESFVDLDAALADINAMSEDGEVDAYQVKAIFTLCFRRGSAQNGQRRLPEFCRLLCDL